MKKIGAILAAILIITISCTDQLEVDKPLDFGFFTLKTPSSWYKFSIQGYDSNVGGITNEQDSLLYDFGWYSNDLSNYTTDTHNRTITVIDGYDALIIQPLNPGEGIIGVSIQVDSLNRFTMTGDSKDNSSILKIFRSIQFN